MSWQQEWTALSQRILGLVEAGAVFARFLAKNSEDPFHGGNELRLQTREVFGVLEQFLEQYGASLPDSARAGLRRWLEDHSRLFSNRAPAATDANDQAVLKAMLPMLAAIESEVTFHLTDRQEHLRLRSERAFSHLQRSVIADEAIRGKWKRAFGQGEVACEKLGAVHLLSHGVWAFKAVGEKGRTDLIFQDTLEDLSEVERAAEGLVLTEWKKANGEGHARQQLDAAREQAERYATDTLAGLELRDCRYLVIVTEKAVTLPPEGRSGDVRYRQVNLAVDPDVPSRG